MTDKKMPTSQDEQSTEMKDAIDQLTSEPVEEKEEIVLMLSDDTLAIDNQEYLIAKDYREGFDKERFGERYSEVLTKFDYVVGDWGFEQLRLKGFYRDDNKRATKDQLISTLEDYLYEYCNFGCAYFVLEHTKGQESAYNSTRAPRPRTTQRKTAPVKKEQPKVNAAKTPVNPKPQAPKKATHPKPQGNKPKTSKPKFNNNNNSKKVKNEAHISEKKGTKPNIAKGKEIHAKTNEKAVTKKRSFVIRKNND